MSESGMRQNLCKALKELDAVPIENSLRAGTPDVNYNGGWIECKWLKLWPKYCNTRPVRFQHPLTKEQGLWLKRRRMRGGVALVAAQISRDWFFFDGIDIKDHFNKMNKDEMFEKAIFTMKNMQKQELIQWLKSL